MLYIPIGIPGCGKSTLAQLMVEAEIIDQDSIVNPDRLRELLTGDITSMEANRSVFQIAHKITYERIKYGLDVYFDATNLKKSDLIEVLKLSPVISQDTITLIYSDTPDEESLKRNSQRERQVPDFVMEKMIQRKKSLDIKALLLEFNVKYVTQSTFTETVKERIFALTCPDPRFPVEAIQ